MATRNGQVRPSSLGPAFGLFHCDLVYILLHPSKRLWGVDRQDWFCWWDRPEGRVLALFGMVEKSPQ